MSNQQDRIRGCLYGLAIGDALGIPWEWQGSHQIQAKTAGPLIYEPTQFREHQWEAGEWSDDTDQALCIIDAYLEDDEEPEFMFAELLQHWLRSNGRGCGGHTRRVVSNKHFLTDPHTVSRAVWDANQRQSAGNGGVMRAAAVGLINPTDLDWTEDHAASICRVTHWDPRCQASAVAVSVAAAMLVMGEDFDTVIAEAEARAQRYDDPVPDWVFDAADLQEILLDEGLEGQVDGGPRAVGAPVGFTYKTCAAGFWALEQSVKSLLNGGDGFEGPLNQVILAGGDTDTNGAVAGALMGAFLGFERLPKTLVDGLIDASELEMRLDGMLL